MLKVMAQEIFILECMNEDKNNLIIYICIYIKIKHKFGIPKMNLLVW